MQAEEKRTDTDSSKVQANESSLSDNEHILRKNSGKEMSGNSHELHEESGSKPAENMLHEGHPEGQAGHAGKKPGHEQHSEEKTSYHEQHEGMKHEGMSSMKK